MQELHCEEIGIKGNCLAEPENLFCFTYYTEYLERKSNDFSLYV